MDEGKENGYKGAIANLQKINIKRQADVRFLLSHIKHIKRKVDTIIGVFNKVGEEEITRQELETIFGTNPSVEELENMRNLIDEWVVELKDDRPIF